MTQILGKKLHLSGLVLICITLFAMPCTIKGDHQANEKAGPFLVYNFGTSGMFAVFSAVLGALDYYEKGNFAGIKIDLCNGSYLDPEKRIQLVGLFF